MSTIGEAAADGHAKRPSPLIRVLAQVRWPVLSSFDVGKAADSLAEAIGTEYPLRSTAHETQLLVTPAGVMPQPGGVLHTYKSADGNWTVTLAETFITLETTAYESHEDFIPKLVEVVSQIRIHLPLKRWERFGYRYTNRIEDPTDIDDLTDLFDAVVLGTIGLDFPDAPIQSVSESTYQSQDSQVPSLLVKSALLPPQAMIEHTIAPLPGRSWLLDLDAFFEGPSNEFDDQDLQRRAIALSQRAHAFFTKVITEEFRKRFDV